MAAADFGVFIDLASMCQKEEKEPGGGAGHREVLRRPSGEEVEDDGSQEDDEYYDAATEGTSKDKSEKDHSNAGMTAVGSSEANFSSKRL